ncbi:MAG TPA: 4Fe-4S dicluster domain-containing protein [Clostridia bacterium]|nr:4Fe-4S dicluster domain-containing protein [Clostridia bacterium]
MSSIVFWIRSGRKQNSEATWRSTLERVSIDEQRCKSCGLCVSVCPVKILVIGDRLNERGFRPAQCTDQDKCTSCSSCALVCPDLAIELHREVKA